MVDYYDLVLGAIPTALLGTTAALTATGVRFTAAVPAGAVVALGLMIHAMFVNAPGDPRTTDRAADADSRSGSGAGVAPPNAD